MTSGPVGVIYDVDGVLRLATPRRQVRRMRGVLLSRSPHDRRSVQAMAPLVRALVTELDEPPVFYLTGLPFPMAPAITGLIERDGHPSGTLITTGPDYSPRWLLGGSRLSKLAAVEHLAGRLPQVRWVLVGDDGGHDPEAYFEFADRHPDRVAVIALRQVLDVDRPAFDVPPPRDVAVVSAPNGEELLPLVRDGLGLARPTGRPAATDWLLTAFERGNRATRLRAWTEGNAVRALVHGRTYFATLASALATAGPDAAVQMVGWRADVDEPLDDDGPTVGTALSGAVARGADVHGLLWRSHLSVFGYQIRQNRAVAQLVTAAGGEVLLDQRIRPLGSHHQKLVVLRHRGRPADDVAFVGGIDLDHGSRDDTDHRGDAVSVGASTLYGDNPAYHDVQLELRGPAVGEAEEVFRERWQDPAALSRLPWQVVPDWFRGLRRSASPLPPAAPAPPAAGSCAVQLLRTYPRRRPPFPFAPLGERSVARAYSKAIARAERMIYVEDQYLWSFDVARIFAAALTRAPRLHLVAVVPRRPDNVNPFYTDPARLGHREALAIVHAAGGDRVQVLDVENDRGRPIYVHAKLCLIDDVWAAVGSANVNNRSWTHDSELTAAVLDDERDPREPVDPAGLGDGARRFARELRLSLLREHLDLDDDGDLLDPTRAAEVVRESAAHLDAWHRHGCPGPRPRGRLRRHALTTPQALPVRQRWITAPIYRAFLDPDGRPLGMRVRRAY